MLKVYEAENLVDAHLALDELQAAGVRAIIKGSMLAGAVGELPTAGLISIWIEGEAQYDRARQVLAIYEKARNEPMSVRYCGHCGEACEGHFSCCWHCGRPLPNT